MPERPRRPRAVRRRDVYTEPDGLFGRIADIVIENPVRSGGFVMILMAIGAIVTNAAYFQTSRHPDPFFATRSEPVASPAPTPMRKATPAPTSGVADAMPPAVTAAPQATPADPAGVIADTQRGLAALGLYDGAIDGKMGPQTRAAISAFETRNNIPQTGRPSAELLQVIRAKAPRAEAAPSDPVATGSIDGAAAMAQLKRVQRALNDIGYGPLVVDGRSGGDTSDAIRRFELDNGLTLSGEAGEEVVQKLVKIGAMKPN